MSDDTLAWNVHISASPIEGTVPEHLDAYDRLAAQALVVDHVESLIDALTAMGLSASVSVADDVGALELDVPDSAWEPACFEHATDGEDPYDGRERLLATIHVLGVAMHLEAYEIDEPDDGGWWRAKVYDEDLGAVFRAVGGDGAWQTTVIGGRRYALIATPHCT